MAVELAATISLNTSEEGCSHLGCTGCGYIFCIEKMKRSTRIKVLWSWLIIITLTLSLILNYVIYGAKSFTASETDMRIVRDKISYIFCSGVEISSKDYLFDAYLIEGELTIQEKRETSQSFTYINLNLNEYKYFQFYFLSGSTVTLSHCSENNVTFYVITGKSNFKLWQENNLCENCYIRKEYLLGRNDCNVLLNYSTFPEYSFNVSIEDSYFLIYANNPFQSTNVSIKCSLYRSVYDVSRASESHFSSLDWSFEIDKPDQNVVFMVKQLSQHLQYNPSENFTTRCICRVWIYVLIFGVGCILTGAISCTLIIGLCKEPDLYTNRIHFITYSERTPLLSGTTPPPSYADVINTPPKYEDVIPKKDNDLPSYQEAVLHVVKNC
ncbi:hypothetical protein CHS0354_035037 [Potamilus streckersoni]|uniref:E3 ubiquitin-protein ligase APD1-4 middle domain-containing protein n=1 Tax=Potamilus streckersoni TaxID=2493646 RepID=A0AAE0SDT6_9BIVA|nr:hypothetical protein CHS0354_035037 [Potamilus streckersoni]